MKPHMSRPASLLPEDSSSLMGELLEDFQIVHLCGKDKIDNLLLNEKGYKQFEYLKATTGTLTKPPLENTTSGFNCFKYFLASE